MKIINSKISYDNMVITKKITKKEIGLMSYVYFVCDYDYVYLRIKKDGRLIGNIQAGDYCISNIFSTQPLNQSDSAGEWEFAVYSLKSTKQLSVEVFFEQEKIENKIFYGDLHSHSICSIDAVNTFSEIEEEVLNYKNDFHAITDHNSYAMNLQYYKKKSGIEFIYGIEMTTKYGHYNFLGKEIPVENCTVNSEKDIIDKILFHKKSGGYVTFNHPFSPKSRICKLPITKEYCDFLEIWNGAWAVHNIIALKWWHKKLLQHIYFPICGGSDTHNIKSDRNYETPINCIIAPSKNQNILLSKLKKGNSFILSKKHIIDIKFYDVIFGDIVDDESFKIQFSSEKEIVLNVIYDNKEETYPINDAPEEYSVKGKNFIRFEAYYKNECIFISNPIFNKSFKFLNNI